MCDDDYKQWLQTEIKTRMAEIKTRMAEIKTRMFLLHYAFQKNCLQFYELLKMYIFLSN